VHSVRPCTVICWREGSSWVVHVPELDRSAPASRLSQVEGVARDLLHVHGSHDASNRPVVVDVRVQEGAGELVSAAADLRDDPDRVSGEVVPPQRAPGGEPAAKPHSSYRHEAFLHHGHDDFLRGTTDFVAEAVALDQPVVVAFPPSKQAPLRAAVGEDAPVHWIDMAEVGANPGRIIPALQAFVEQHAGRPVRAVGEPVWGGRRADEVAECQVHEALLNVAVEPDVPLWLRCVYDVQALDDEVLLEVSRSHPALVEDGDYRGSLHYRGIAHVQDVLTADLPTPEGALDELAFDRVGLAGVRPRVFAAAGAAGIGPERSAELALAVTEAATNSVRHGGGAGVLRLWQTDDALVCEVSDAGRIEDPLAGRRAPAHDAEGGRGLWLVHQLGDLVQVRSGERGTAVRVHTWR
jgi:anti-sigma regulatory factor (Ser/Thr protein kinase)